MEQCMPCISTNSAAPMEFAFQERPAHHSLYAKESPACEICTAPHHLERLTPVPKGTELCTPTNVDTFAGVSPREDTHWHVACAPQANPCISVLQALEDHPEARGHLLIPRGYM